MLNSNAKNKAKLELEPQWMCSDFCRTVCIYLQHGHRVFPLGTVDVRLASIRGGPCSLSSIFGVSLLSNPGLAKNKRGAESRTMPNCMTSEREGAQIVAQTSFSTLLVFNPSKRKSSFPLGLWKQTWPIYYLCD